MEQIRNMNIILAICKFCEQSFAPEMFNGKLELPLHKDQSGFFTCESCLNPFLVSVKNAEDFAGFDPATSKTVQPLQAEHLKSKTSDSIQIRFENFHRDNPKIYDWLLKFAMEAKNAGFKKFAIRPIIERARWFVYIETKGDDFKINNDFCSRYARLLMQQESALTDFFEIRVLRSEKDEEKFY